MESSCDEKVLEKMGMDIKKGYSLSLVRLSAEERWFGAPLAFGEKPIKTRVKHILQYKKPVSVVAGLAVVAAVAVGCAIWSAPEKVDEGSEIIKIKEEQITDMVEKQGSHIIDREVMQATQHARVDGLLGENVSVEVWSEKCRFQLDSDKSLQLPRREIIYIWNRKNTPSGQCVCRTLMKAALTFMNIQTRRRRYLVYALAVCVSMNR